LDLSSSYYEQSAEPILCNLTNEVVEPSNSFSFIFARLSHRSIPSQYGSF